MCDTFIARDTTGLVPDKIPAWMQQPKGRRSWELGFGIETKSLGN